MVWQVLTSEVQIEVTLFKHPLEQKNRLYRPAGLIRQ